MAALVAVFFVWGCGPEPPGKLEIGIRNSIGWFEPLEDGGSIPVVRGMQGLDMIVPCLRASEIDPHAPTPTVEVTVEGVIIGAEFHGARMPMEYDGVGYVLWDLNVPFRMETCCFLCRNAHIEAKVEDRDGRTFEDELTVQLEDGVCPDPRACCANAVMCDPPGLARPCE